MTKLRWLLLAAVFAGAFLFFTGEGSLLARLPEEKIERILLRECPIGSAPEEVIERLQGRGISRIEGGSVVDLASSGLEVPGYSRAEGVVFRGFVGAYRGFPFRIDTEVLLVFEPEGGLVGLQVKKYADAL